MKEYQKTSCMKLEHEIDAVSVEQAAIDFMKMKKSSLYFGRKKGQGHVKTNVQQIYENERNDFLWRIIALLPECGTTGERKKVKVYC